MLVSLSIRDIVLIDKLDLTFTTGLTIFTGETGAGKSIILDSLSLALGSRGNASLVRQGASCGAVTACFELPANHGLANVFHENGLLDGDGVILKRLQFSDGRTKAFVNDHPVSSALLKRIGSALVEIHGQHDDRALLDSGSHRTLLDQFGELTHEAQALSLLWKEWRALEKQIIDLAEQNAAKQRDADYLRAAYEELQVLNPQTGEEETLAEKRQLLQASARVQDDLKAAAHALSSQEFPATKIAAILRRLERQPHQADSIKGIAQVLDRVLIEAEEARILVDTALQESAEDNIDLIEERLFKLRAVARKHRVPISELTELRDRLQKDLAAMETDNAQLIELKKTAVIAAKAYESAALKLSENRKAAGYKLDRAVQKELKPLRLEKAKFLTHFENILDGVKQASSGAYGRETVTFFVQTNPGAKPGPIMKVASGGELARFLLALKVVLAEKNTAPVLVFDEIDTGMGGATSAAIGERLARLGAKAQVLAVTHSPQVAAYADAHFRLYKSSRNAGNSITAETSAESLDEPGRREEIARMLAGREVTQEARAAADRLMGGKHESHQA